MSPKQTNIAYWSSAVRSVVCARAFVCGRLAGVRVSLSVHRDSWMTGARASCPIRGAESLEGWKLTTRADISVNRGSGNSQQGRQRCLVGRKPAIHDFVGCVVQQLATRVSRPMTSQRFKLVNFTAKEKQVMRDSRMVAKKQVAYLSAAMVRGLPCVNNYCRKLLPNTRAMWLGAVSSRKMPCCACAKPSRQVHVLSHAAQPHSLLHDSRRGRQYRRGRKAT